MAENKKGFILYADQKELPCIPFLYNKISEATIQGELYHKLRKEGITCYLEYKYEDCRFDCVIIVGSKVYMIIECKSYKRDSKKPITNTKQYKKYSKYGIPVLYCVRWTDISKTVLSVKTYLQS